MKAVITAADLPKLADKIEQGGEAPVNLASSVVNILARDKVLYDGHAVAAVAATSAHIAEEALRLIEVDYEVLPPVMTVEDAMKPGAPILLPSLRNKEDGPDKQTNVANHMQFKRGDIEEGFKQADYVVEREFKTAMVHQGYIEPHNAVGIYNADGHAHDLLLDPGHLRRALADFARARDARGQYQGRAGRDRRRLRRQADGLSRAARRCCSRRRPAIR